MSDLEAVKLWLRVEHDDEDVIIQSLIDAAKDYAQTAVGGPEINWSESRACLLLYALVADWYEHREYTGNDVSTRSRPTIRNLIWQLRYGRKDDDNAS